jgi:hypothetical protein
MIEMNPTLKSILKATAVVIVPGMTVLWLANRFVKDQNEKQEFREYVHKTYGQGSKYENDHVE